MKNSKVTEIIKFSLYKNIKNKWFMLFNIFTLVSIVIMLNWSSISNLFKIKTEETTFNVAFIDNSNLIYDDLLDVFTDDNYSNITIEKISENNYSAENIPNDFAIVEIISDENEGFKTAIISKEGIDSTIYSTITNTLHDLRNSILSQKYNLSENDLEILQSDLSVERILLSVDASNSSSKELIKLFSSFFTYFVAILIFSKIANEIAQEKQSKSSEYILTTVSAKEYLFAKVFSNIAILIIQGLLLFVYYSIAIGLTNIISISSSDLNLNVSSLINNISLDIIIYILALLIYNILTIILLCIVQATLAAKTSSTSEAGNTVSLLTFLMMAAYIVSITFITPYTQVNTILQIFSCIPGLSAFFIPAMMVIGQSTPWQIIFSLLLLVISIPLTFNFCSPIFKNGILDYTKFKNIKINKLNEPQKINNFLTKRSMKNVGFVIGMAILIYVGSQTLLSLLGEFLLSPVLAKYFTQTDITLILQMILQIISLSLAATFVFSYCKNNTTNLEKNSLIAKNKISAFEKFKIVLITLLLVYGLQILLSIVIYPNLGLDYNVTDMFTISPEANIISKLIVILGLAVVPAIFEEIFFRKALIDYTLPYGRSFALLFSSLLFGILHMNLSQGLFAFIIGIIFGIIYLYTKDIKITMLIHFINNGLAALTLILPEMGILITTILLIGFLVIGFVFLIITLIKKESRNKIRNFLFTRLSLDTIKTKYIYIFTDFTFNVSLLLITIMSILTENLLR